MQFIGVTGRVGAGKDTVCNMARELLIAEGLRVEVIACADPLKNICAEIFGRGLRVPRRAFFGSQDDKETELSTIPGWTGRRIMKHIGTEGFRKVHTEVWSAYMLNTAKNFFENGIDVVLVSDVRFLSEAEAIQKNGGVILRLYRKRADIVPADHTSETALDDIRYDYIIDNHERDLYCLQELVKEFLCQRALISSPSTPKPRG